MLLIGWGWGVDKGGSRVASGAGEWGPLSGCGAQASHRGGFLWAPVAVAHGLICSVTCGFLVPGSESKPVSPALAGGFFFFFFFFNLSGG